MKKVLLAAVAVFIASSFCSCGEAMTVKGNGVTSEKVIAVNGDYRELNVSNGINVILSPTEQGRATIIADQLVMEYVSIVESNGRLTISYKPQVSVNSPITTTVTLPLSGYLSYLGVSSAAFVRADNVIISNGLHVECSSAAEVRARIESPELRVEVSSAGKCNIDGRVGKCNISASSAARFTGNLSVRELSADISSSAGCTVEGKCDFLKIEASSASSFHGYELETAKAFVDASSSGSANIYVTDELGVSISSAASVRYKGSPRLTSQDISSGASLKNID